MKLNSNFHLTFRALAVMAGLALSTASVFAGSCRKTHSERGTVSSVDVDAHTLVITDLKKNTEHKFLWNELTRFTERGKTSSAADLKPGERVRIRYAGSGEGVTLRRVHIAAAKAMKS